MRVMQGLALCGLLLLGVLSGTPAQAQCDPTQACCRVTNPGGSPGCAGAGNPINLVSGNKYQHEVDLPALPGLLGLAIERHYNSAFSATASTPRSPVGLFGRGWHFGHETSLLIGHAGGGADDINRITLRQADGTLVFFARGILDASRFVASDPAKGYLSADLVRREYAWVHPDGQRWEFDRTGALQAIRAASGESLRFLRFNGELLRITDPQGRELSIHTAPGQVHIDTPVGRFSYELSQEPAPRLLSATLPDGTRRTYHYEDRRAGLLTGISVQGKDDKTAERISTWAYDEQGRAILSAKGPRADWSHDANRRQLPGTGLEQVEVAYEADHTVLTNSLGQKTTYHHAHIAHARRLTEIRGAGCATCAEPNVRYAYDFLGRVTEVAKLDDQGNPIDATRTRYGARGWPVEVSRVGFQKGKERPAIPVVRYEYGHPDPHTTNQPTLIARPSVVPGKEHQLRITYNDAGQPTRVTESGFSPIDERGQPAPAGAPISRSTTYTYQNLNGRSLLAQVDGPLPNGPQGDPSDSDVTRYEWDGLGNQIVVLTSPGATHTLQYDKAGRVRHVRNEQGQASELRYDAQGRLLQSSQSGPGEAKANVQTLRYDHHGRPVEMGSGEPGTDTYRGQWLRTYDTAGRLTERDNAIGVVERWVHDTEGRLVEQRRATSTIDQITRYVRGAAGESPDALAVPTDPVRSLSDDFGRVVQTTTPDGGTTTRHFDAADRLVAMRDALGNVAQYHHDPAGRIQSQSITSKEGESVRTTWRYQGRQLAELNHPTQSERYAYDARGLRIARIVTLKASDGREHTAVTRYEHDEEGQLTATTLPDGSRVEHRRNGQGQVVAMTRHRVATGWLRGLEREELIAQAFERDLVGLRGYTAGNGVQAQFQRSREGVLARVVYRRPTMPTRDAQQQAQRGFERLLGIAAAHAAAPTLPSEPGALGVPADPQAFIDHRYLWDARGNLLLDAQRAGTPQDTGYAYDPRNRLVVASSRSGASRYLYDPLGRRVLAQEAVADAADLHTGTRRIEHVAEAYRWTSDGEQRADYDAAGQPTAIGPRRFEWDALGRLTRVSEGEQVLGSYRYSHRGERIEKQSGQGSGREHVLYLYDDARQLSAELDAQGHIRRQYVYAADLPIVVIDTPQGQELQAEVNGWQQTWQDLGHLARSWLPRASELRWLHTNHLGAPEAATDAQEEVVWRATYAASGRAKADATPFTLSLRLPGQYEDPETGLHYNGQRYYDPERGQYLSPDPLAQQPGYPDGPNPYSYVRYNPLRYVDPSGLILFAFDGTDNTDDLAWLRDRGSSLSNVVRFRDAYNDGNRRYVTGVGTLHSDDTYGDIVPPPLDRGLNHTGADRIDRMLVYLMLEAEAQRNDNEFLDIDIVGFSRGAAQARDFSNLVADMTDAQGRFNYNEVRRNVASGGSLQRFAGSQCVRFRFMGLWDTVLSQNNSGLNYRLGIPARFEYVAHAVALNEYRSGSNWDTRNPLPEQNHWGGFPLVSIGSTPSRPGAVRIERGFIGAHADIGGGYSESDNQLAAVALRWMVGQAQIAGVNMNLQSTPIPASNPVIHDQSNAIWVGNPLERPRTTIREGRSLRPITIEDRTVAGAAGGSTQRTMRFNNPSMTNADTHQFIQYSSDRAAPNPRGSTNEIYIRGLAQSTGRVDIDGYMAWLRANGYCFTGDACAQTPRP